MDDIINELSVGIICRNKEGKFLYDNKVDALQIPLVSVLLTDNLFEEVVKKIFEQFEIKMSLIGVLRVEYDVVGMFTFILYFECIYSQEKTDLQWNSIEDLNKIPLSEQNLFELIRWPLYLETSGFVLSTNFISTNTPKEEITLYKFTNENLPMLTKALPMKELITSEQYLNAIHNNDSIFIRKSLLNGINPNGITNKKGWTPLHIAIKLKHLKIISLLLMCDADLSATTKNGHNCLSFAVQEEPNIFNMIYLKLNLLEQALKNKIINQQDHSHGNTPLHIICQLYRKGKECLYYYNTLNDMGADKTIKNKEGKTADDILNEFEFKDDMFDDDEFIEEGGFEEN